MAEPRSREELMRVLGVMGYYRGFVMKYANYIQPFRDVLSVKNRFQCTDNHAQAFGKLKMQFVDMVVLKHYIVKEPFRIQTDASKAGISAILYQFDKDNNLRIVTLISRTLTKHESAYGATELELLAIIYAVIKLRTYLLAKKFYIVTYHQALTFHMHTPFSNARLIRWSLILQEYDFEIRYCKGRDNIVADYFSRYFSPAQNRVESVQKETMEGDFLHVQSKLPGELIAIDFFGELPTSTGV